MKNKIKLLIEKEIDAIRNIPVDGVIEAALSTIHERVHENGGKK